MSYHNISIIVAIIPLEKSFTAQLKESTIDNNSYTRTTKNKFRSSNHKPKDMSSIEMLKPTPYTTSLFYIIQILRRPLKISKGTTYP